MTRPAAVESNTSHNLHTFSGALDASNSHLVAEALASSYEAGIFQIVIDLSKVTFVNSSVMKELIRGLRRCKEEKGKLKVILDPKGRAFETLEMAGYMLIAQELGGEVSFPVPVKKAA